jgi:cytidylate kinase
VLRNKINIAIDGFSSCGKSTIAKQLAKHLNYIHIDSGAMYRAVTHYFLKHGIDISKPEEIIQALDKINIHFENIQGENNTFLNGINVSREIRSKEVNDFVSEVATLNKVRSKMVFQQHDLALNKGVVMDGRDIGTVVLPDAEIKLFITANVDIRTQRRKLEMNILDNSVTFEEIQRNLLMRDRIDSTREHSPLIQAEDAIVIDNSYLNESEQLVKVLNIIEDLFPEVMY